MNKARLRTGTYPLWVEILLIILIPILGMALGVATMFLLNLNGTDYGNLIINLFFLINVIVLIRLFKFSSEDLGAKVIQGQMQKHVVLSLAIFTFYMLFYVFVICISTLKPFSSGTLWGLATYLIVVFAEELYFRGALYSFFEKRFSAKTALIVSSILFGLFHAQQGLRGMILRAFTGFLWGSVRYSTGMIFCSSSQSTLPITRSGCCSKGIGIIRLYGRTMFYPRSNLRLAWRLSSFVTGVQREHKQKPNDQFLYHLTRRIYERDNEVINHEKTKYAHYYKIGRASCRERV